MKFEGRNAVLELLKTDKNIDKILMEKNPQGSLLKIFSEARKTGVRVQFADKKALDRESSEGRHQGVIAYASDYAYSSLDDIISSAKENSVIVLCDGIEDVHNLGSIIRVDEIARLLRVPQGTVKSRLSRARAQLKEMLQDQEGEYGTV